MYTIQRFSSNIAYSNIIVALAAGFLSCGWTYYQGIPKWYLYGLFAANGTLFVYTFQRMYKLNKSSTYSPSLNWLRHNRQIALLILIASLIMSVSTLIILANYSYLIALLLLGAVVISAFYVIPLFGKSFRELPGMKSVFISIVWVSILFVFPWLNEITLFHLNPWSFLAYFFLFHALAIPFDIRDMKYDQGRMKTLPLLLGLNGSRILSLLFLIVFSLIIAKINVEMRLNILFWCTILLQAYLLLTISEEKREGYFILLDGSMILIGLSYFLI